MSNRPGRAGYVSWREELNRQMGRPNYVAPGYTPRRSFWRWLCSWFGGV